MSKELKSLLLILFVAIVGYNAFDTEASTTKKPIHKPLICKYRATDKTLIASNPYACMRRGANPDPRGIINVK